MRNYYMTQLMAHDHGQDQTAVRAPLSFHVLDPEILQKPKSK